MIPNNKGIARCSNIPNLNVFLHNKNSMVVPQIEIY